MKFFTIDSGFFSTDGGAMFGIMSRKIWASKYPVDNENRCPLAMRCLFVDFGARKVLFDTGVGSKPIGMSYYRFHHLVDVVEALQRHGYQADEVTDVVLSHLHFDHCGGCTRIDDHGQIVPCFPKAIHWASKAQWENSLHPKLWEADAYLAENLQAVHEAGLLHLIDQDTQVFEGLQLRLFEGHSFGQIASFIETDQGNLVFSGDIVPMAMHIMPACVAAIDNHALASVEEKNRLLTAAHQTNSRLVFYHDAQTLWATLKRTNHHYSIAEKQVSDPLELIAR